MTTSPSPNQMKKKKIYVLRNGEMNDMSYRSQTCSTAGKNSISTKFCDMTHERRSANQNLPFLPD